jgi:hypothetical protein
MNLTLRIGDVGAVVSDSIEVVAFFNEEMFVYRPGVVAVPWSCLRESVFIGILVGTVPTVKSSISVVVVLGTLLRYDEVVDVDISSSVAVVWEVADIALSL